MPFAKIRHRGVFIERQGLDATGYRYICHTGILKFLPDLYDTQDDAIKAIDAKLDRSEVSAFTERETPEPNYTTELLDPTNHPD